MRYIHGETTLHGIHQIKIKRTIGDDYDVIKFIFSGAPTQIGNDEFTVTAFLRLDKSKLIVRKTTEDPNDLIQRVIRVAGVVETKSYLDQIIGGNDE